MEENNKILFLSFEGVLTKMKQKTGNITLRFDVIDQIAKYNPSLILIVENIPLGKSSGILEARIEYVKKIIQEFFFTKTVDATLINELDCRTINSHYKPATGMLKDFQNKYHFKKEDCVMVGRNNIDQQTAMNFGIFYSDVEDFIKIKFDK